MNDISLELLDFITQQDRYTALFLWLSGTDSFQNKRKQK